MNPLVSVVLPVRNGEPFVGAAIQSVLDQTLTDLEVLVIENGSTDHTLDVVCAFAERDSRVVVIEAGPIGLVAALNTGLARARGTYVARMDADDVCRPDRFEHQIALLDSDQEIAVVGSQVRYVDENGRPGSIRHVPVNHGQIVGAFHFGNPIAHPTVMFAPARIDTELRYSDRFPDAEDLAMWVQLARHHRLRNLPVALVDHRVHPASVSAQDGAGWSSSLAILTDASPWRPQLSKWIHERTFNALQAAVPLHQFIGATVVLNAVNLVRPWAPRRHLLTRSAIGIASFVRRRGGRIASDLAQSGVQLHNSVSRSDRQR